MGVLTAWALAAGIQIYRDVAKLHRAPFASEFLASGAVFGGLALLDRPTQGVAGVIAWGFLLAITLQAGGPAQLVASGSQLPVAQAAFPGAAGGPTVQGPGGKPVVLNPKPALA